MTQSSLPYSIADQTIFKPGSSINLLRSTVYYNDHIHASTSEIVAQLRQAAEAEQMGQRALANIRHCIDHNRKDAKLRRRSELAFSSFGREYDHSDVTKRFSGPFCDARRMSSDDENGDVTQIEHVKPTVVENPSSPPPPPIPIIKSPIGYKYFSYC